MQLASFVILYPKEQSSEMDRNELYALKFSSACYVVGRYKSASIKAWNLILK